MNSRSTKKMDDPADQMIHDLLQEVITKSYARGDEDKVAHALLAFLVRVANTWRSIRTLREHTEDSEGFMVDAGTLLRALYDAYLQAEYLVSDPKQSLVRASDYFDFEHVERYKSMTKMLNAGNWIANRLKWSPKRREGEKENEQKYNEVKDRFLRKPTGSSTRNQWYPGDLRKIADVTGKSDEYDTLLATFNGCVHSSASALHNGPPVKANHVLTAASTIAAKVARLNVVHNTLTLSPDFQRLLAVLCNSPD